MADNYFATVELIISEEGFQFMGTIIEENEIKVVPKRIFHVTDENYYDICFGWSNDVTYDDFQEDLSEIIEITDYFDMNGYSYAFVLKDDVKNLEYNISFKGFREGEPKFITHEG